ncbi:transcription factor Spn1p [Trichomonascus vanleenenianus]|uniref:transcription factor SPN1 n=1 Tax=Trichomonascus vanleenenianus TaxID=2268995 RepID=UPI003ECA987A
MSDDEERMSQHEEEEVKQEDKEENKKVASDVEEDALSDVDEDQFKQEEKPIDESVYNIKVQKRTGSEFTAYEPAEKKREKSHKRSAEAEDQENDFSDAEEQEEEVDPETRQRRELERRMDEALKGNKKRKKKLDGDDLEQMQDEKIQQLRNQMYAAAQADGESIRTGVPAVNKLQLLPEVRAVLQKQTLADSILDNNLLEAIRMWLEPLPDASLPAFEIQKELFAAIERLPIKTIHLRESGLGKVVLFYQRSKRPQLNIKRTADKLIGDWTRPIMGRSDNYRDKYVASRVYDPEEMLAMSRSVGAMRKGSVSASSMRSPAEAAAIRRNRAHIPEARGVSFDVAPKSTVPAGHVAPGNRGDDAFRSIRQKMQNRGVKGKKSGVSIEGKELRH